MSIVNNDMIFSVIDDSKITSEEKLNKLLDMGFVFSSGSVDSRALVIKEAINDFFSNFEKDDFESYDRLSSDIIDFCNKKIELDNALGKHAKYKLVSELSRMELSLIIPHLYTFKNVRRDTHASDDMTDLMYFSEDGWYKSATKLIEQLCRSMNYNIIKRDIQEVEDSIRFFAGEPVDEERNPDWVFCKNGIFEKEYYKVNNKLIPYSEDIIAVNPLPVAFNPSAVNSKFIFNGEEFDFEDFLLEIANGDVDIRNLFWNVLSALVYHNRNYKKAVFLYSPLGNNGKGTVLSLCRNLVGSELCVDIPVESFADKNLVVNLANARLVTGDENAVDVYVDNVTNFKNAVTGDPITVDRKYRNALTFSFSGLILQCMNGLPTSKDKTNSFFRRILLIPFNNCFTGKENPLIKGVYLKDKDVLEYVLYKALMLNVKQLDDVSATEELLKEYKEDNDTLLQWWADEGSQVNYVWNRIPWILLYSSYRWWMKYNTIRGDVNLGIKKFTKEFKLKILPLIGDTWAISDSGSFSVGRNFDEPEPLIGKYDVEELKNPNYTGKDWYKIGSNGGQYKPSYKGLMRV